MRRWTVRPNAPEELLPIFQEPGGVLRHAWPGGSLLSGREGSDEVAGGVVWTGSMAELDGGGLFDAHPRTWGTAGWAALEAAAAGIASQSKAALAIRPHARHVVSDIPGIRRFGTSIAAHHPGRFQLLLDPASMLDLSHIEHRSAEDTLRRIAAELPALDTPELPLIGVVVANIRRDGDRLLLVPIDDGEVDPGLIRSLFTTG
jgi:hypothetical protein